MLKNDKKKALRSLAHHEKPVVIMGKNGLTETVLESFENALVAHNLVKISLLKTCPLDPKEIGEELAEQFGAELVSVVGRVIVLYRYSKEGRIKV